jgi:ankyrin repeat protein
MKVPFEVKKFRVKMKIFEAVETGNVEKLTKWIEMGESINSITKFSRTLLHNACFYKHLEIVTCLVQNGADLEAKDIMGWTPLRYSLAHQDLEIISYLVEQGADIDALSARNWTCLHSAAGVGNFEFCEYFVKKGANIELKTIDGLTPIHVACVYGQKCEIVKLLLDHGANIEAQDPKGNTALQLSAQIGSIDMVQLLLQSNCDPFGITSTKFWDSRVLDMVHEYQRLDLKKTESCRSLIKGARQLISCIPILSMEICILILEWVGTEFNRNQIRILSKVLMDRNSLGKILPLRDTKWYHFFLESEIKVSLTNRELLKRCSKYLELQK